MDQIIFKDLVLLGGGHAHVHTIKMFGMNPIPGVRVTLISRDIESPYSGMIPGLIAGKYSHDECHIDLMKLCSFASVRFIHAEACGLDSDLKLISCADGRPSLHYDILSLDIGICPKPMVGNMGKYSNITPVKPIDKFSRRWDGILHRVLNTDQSQPLRVVIVGGGGGGCELAFAIHYRLCVELKESGRNSENVCVSLATRTSELLAGHSRKTKELILRILKSKNIKVFFNFDVVSANEVDGLVGGRLAASTEASALVSSTGEVIPFDECIWCTQAEAQGWLKDTGLDTTSEGFVRVSPTLQSVNSPDVFACGDVAHLEASPRPKAGVFAVRAGPPLTRNLRARITGGSTLEQWTPQDQFLGLVGTFGTGLEADSHWGAYAVGSKGGLCLEGHFLWTLKDKIDREFMRLFSELPDKETMMRDMAQKSESFMNSPLGITADQDMLSLLSKSRMRCGGCGSKVGSTVLSRVLKSIKQSIVVSDSIISGVGGGDDAAIVVPPAAPALSVHTIDYFRSFISDPYLFGKIAANHSLSDVFAMNATATSALALCVVPYGPEEQVSETLMHMLAGSVDVLNAEGCSLVGGHTSEGADLALGLSVNGSVLPDMLLRKGPLHSGEVLILTKPLGTGTLLAADMRGLARGKWVHGALVSMQQSNKRAAAVLRDRGCKAATDVTGFGLLGHLLEMIKHDEDSDIIPRSIELVLDAIPLLAGAAECVRLGILSSLQPQNIRSSRAIGNPDVGANHPAYAMLFDPQTSGGLLASVPASGAEDTVRLLQQVGYGSAAIIGRVLDNGPSDGFRLPRSSKASQSVDDVCVWLQ